MSKARQLADLGNQVDDGAITGSNMVVNGAMTVAQRGVSFSGLTASQFCLDRFSNDIGGGGAITVAQSSTAPADFKNSMSLTVATADASIAGSDAYRITHAIEGQNVFQLNWGTSDAKSVTLSFWVRSSVTGTYGLGFANSAETENYIAEYNISSANTWEYKTITIEGRTSGTWLDTNGVGIGIRWDLGSGTNYNGTAGSWQTTGGKVYRTSSCVNWIATTGATFYITGVQLEVGDTATPFEHRSYGDELARCQRYFQRFGNLTGNTINGICNVNVRSATDKYAVIHHPVVPRAQPTVGYSSLSDFILYAGSSSTTPTGFTYQGTTASGSTEIQINTNSFGSSGWGGWLRLNSSTGYLDFDMEL